MNGLGTWLESPKIKDETGRDGSKSVTRKKNRKKILKTKSRSGMVKKQFGNPDFLLAWSSDKIWRMQNFEILDEIPKEIPGKILEEVGQKMKPR